MKISSTLTVMILCTSPLLSQSTLYQWSGASDYDNFGNSVSDAGDLNHDGYNDVIVGAYLADPNGLSNAGSAYAYSGRTGLLLYQWDGASTADYFGRSVAAAGDVNNDGFDDVIVGADQADPGGLSAAGSAYIYSGADGSLLYRFDGSSDLDFFGRSVSGAGDVNGDGFADVIVGAYLADGNGFPHAGSAYVYSGSTGLLLHQWHGNSDFGFFGYSVSSAGDIDSDGFDDLIVGAYDADPNGLYGAGSVYLFSGYDGSTLYQLNGASDYDYFGYSVATLGDVNGDSVNDFVIGAKGHDAVGLTNSGAAYVYSGASGNLLHQFYGASNSLFFGFSVSGAGDVNGDGLKDVIIGTNGVDASGYPLAGTAYVYSVSNGVLLHQFEGGSDFDQFGYSVSGAGDLNGDGFDDVLVGAFMADPNNQDNSGSTYAYSCRPNADYTINNLIAGQNAVFDVSSAPPYSHISIAYSITGPGPTNTPFGIVDLSVPIRLLFTTTAGPLGNASFTKQVPLGAAGIILYTQAKCGSMLSNSLALTVQ
jgi:hypothetical protein